MMSIRNALGALLEPQQVSANRVPVAARAHVTFGQELPFCGVIQGQYIAWERTVYVQTPIDKLPQARLPFRNRIAVMFRNRIALMFRNRIALMFRNRIALMFRNRIALMFNPACRAHACSRASPCSLSSGTTRTRASERP
jgi:hypothetical protein